MADFDMVEEVRMLLQERDASDNPSLGDLDFEDEQIEWALDRAVAYWNESPPIMASQVYTDASDFPYIYNLSTGAAGELLVSTGLRLKRNQIPVKGEGVSYDLRARADVYLAAGAEMRATWRNWVAKRKADLNASSYVGGVNHTTYS